MEIMIKQEKPEKKQSSTVYVLSIDLGSGGPKVAVISDTGDVIASAAESVAIHLLPNGGAEQDPREWWNCVRKAVKRAVGESGIPPEDIVAISCDSQYSVVVPIDEQGEALMNAVHWMDTRGGHYNRALISGFPPVQGYGMFKLIRWIRLTGIAPTKSGIDNLGHILFIKNERPDIYEKTYKFLEPMDYLTLKLTGRCTASQHTMLMMIVVDNRKWSSLEYSEQLLKLAGLERDKFPELIPNDDIVGTILPQVAEELGLSPSTRVMAGMNDTNATAIGSGAVRDFDGVICIGTTLVMTCHIPFKKTGINHMIGSMPSPLESRYLLIAEQGSGGKSLEFYLRNIVYADDEFHSGPMPDDAYERANRVAAGVPAGSEGVLFLPWLTGTIAPDENPLARMGILNLSLNTSRGHVVRALMEGIAYNNRWTCGPAEKLIGRKFNNFRFGGGGALSDLWAQIHADVLGVPIHQVVDPNHMSARGAALLAFHKLGYRSIDELPGLVKIKRIFEPNESNREVYDRMYGQFREAYKRNRNIFVALNRE
jgi:xylulokinase